MTNWDNFYAGIEYEAKGELIEERVEAEGLPKFTDGNNVALRTKMQKLCWTEDLGANIVNLDGYLSEDWRDGQREWRLGDDRIFIPDTIEMKLSIPDEELIEGAKMRASEDSTHFAYILGSWACLAKNSSHVVKSSAKAIHATFREVMEDTSIPTPDDATSEAYNGGRR